MFPLELLEYIGMKLVRWDDIWSFSEVFIELRQIERFARYARQCFICDRINCEQYPSDIPVLNWGDDRCRHLVIHYDDDFECNNDMLYEHWRINHAWVCYNIDVKNYDKSQSNKMWCYLPFGENFQNDKLEYDLYFFRDRYETRNTYNDIKKACEVKDIVKLPTWNENRIKEQYDNLFKQMIIQKYNNSRINFIKNGSDNNIDEYQWTIDFIFGGILYYDKYHTNIYSHPV